MRALAFAFVAACGGTPREAERPDERVGTTAAPDAPRAPDPDLHREPPRKLLDIDWSSISIASDADARALWARIAPTGADWDEKLLEVPGELGKPLAIALLRGGQFACTRPAAADCTPPVIEIDPPAQTAGLADPCLRRMLALWALSQLDDADAPAVMDALRGIAALPPPESQLVAAAIHAWPETAHAERLELLGIAWRAGQRDLVNSSLGPLAEAQLIEAVTRHHIDGALEVLSARGHRATYVAAITDEQLSGAARIQAIDELIEADAGIAPDVTAALAKATGSADCAVAAAAARRLEQHGDRRFVPKRPRTQAPSTMMRALCVLASYERLAGAEASSRLAGFVAARGLEQVIVTYDPLSEIDSDGDGDPHTQRAVDLIPRAAATLPEPEDLVRAMRRCTGSTCLSADREFRFGWKKIGGELWLSRIEVVERPPCR